MMWNLVPHFYKGDSPKSHGYKTNNCRVESVHEKPMFSHLLKKGHRCVVLCDGFYEWQTNTKEKKKTPYLIYAPQPDHVRVWDRSSWEGKKEADQGWQGPTLLTMAGLFSRWKSANGEEVWSYTVLTMEAGSGFNWLHHRVPVMLETEQQIKNWLDPGVPDSEVLNRISDSPSLKWHVVSSAVNNSRNNFVDCLKPTEPNKKQSTPSCKLMSAWLSKAPRKNVDTLQEKAGKTGVKKETQDHETSKAFSDRGASKKRASEDETTDKEDKKIKLE